eukprot:408732-Karenia_brevis.AAC.1
MILNNSTTPEQIHTPTLHLSKPIDINYETSPTTTIEVQTEKERAPVTHPVGVLDRMIPAGP